MTSNPAQLPGGVLAVERTADLPRQAWDALTRPSDVFLTTRWLDVVESTAGVPMTYLWVEREGALTLAPQLPELVEYIKPAVDQRQTMPFAGGMAD